MFCADRPLSTNPPKRRCSSRARESSLRAKSQSATKFHAWVQSNCTSSSYRMRQSVNGKVIWKRTSAENVPCLLLPTQIIFSDSPRAYNTGVREKCEGKTVFPSNLCRGPGVDHLQATNPYPTPSPAPERKYILVT